MDTMKGLLKELHEFSFLHNKTIGDLLLANEGRDIEKAIQLFSHILDAHHIWVSRINGVKNKIAVWEVLPVGRFGEVITDNFNQTMTILERVDLSTIVAYTNTQGNSYKNTVQDILLHVVNHTTYHRGQVAMELRKAGIAPPITDYIAYKR
ncbi:MAG TPA: DinB family protein [Cyclobacteriaceae bacterium]|nr:DinB family protein [Cyclobacteriaceae bacterium]